MKKNKRSFLNKEERISCILASLKGISQVMLIENAAVGILIVVAICCSSFYLGMVALISSLIGTMVGKLGGADEKEINQGLWGFNPVLTGMALTIFLSGPYEWIIALAGSAAAAIVSAAMMQMMKKNEIPILSFPYIVLTWFILLSAYKLENIKLTTDLVPQDLTNWNLNTEGEIYFVDAFSRGIAQIFFLDNTFSGILIFIAVFLAGKKLGMCAVVGSVVSIVVAYFLGGEHTLIAKGLYGYNAILSIIAVSEVFYPEPDRNTRLSGLISACLTVPVTAGISILLLPYGLPVLSLPFVLCTWIFLAARKVLPKL